MPQYSNSTATQTKKGSPRRVQLLLRSINTQFVVRKLTLILNTLHHHPGSYIIRHLRWNWCALENTEVFIVQSYLHLKAFILFPYSDFSSNKTRLYFPKKMEVYQIKTLHLTSKSCCQETMYDGEKQTSKRGERWQLEITFIHLQ